MHPGSPAPRGDAGRNDRSVGAGRLGVSAGTRLVTSFVVGVAAAWVLTVLATWRVGLLVGWMAAAALFVAWMWLTIWRMDAAAALLLLGGASIAGGRPTQAALSLASVVLAWATVHTMYTARYARMYYVGAVGGIDFNVDEPPRYSDFAYFAFTVGMTYQVSDTNIRSTAIRAAALRQGLLSYVFGTGIIATMINLVAGLSR